MFEGTRVIDLSQEPGWLTGKILGDLGADVIKVEAPGGDPGRVGPWLGGQPDSERSLKWLALNTSKRGVTLDWKRERGAELLAQLLERADVLLETLPPGTLDARGLGDEALQQRNPRLVHCVLTPFGRTGPRAHWRGHDLVLVAMGGNAAVTGDPDRPPVRCTLPTAYLAAGPEAAAGIAMALYAREDTGRGQLVDVSMHEAQLATLMTGPGQFTLHRRLGGRGGDRIGRTREIWPAKDGWITFGLRGGQARIPNLEATVVYMAEDGMAPDWLRDYDWAAYNHNTVAPEEIARLEEAFAAFFATKSRRELYEQALARRIMLAPCNDAREISEQPQLRHRELFTTLDYPELGAAIEHPAFFARSSRGDIGIRGRAPRIGEHNAEVYAELGLEEDDLARLRGEGVI